jgi:hypothetical protein
MEGKRIERRPAMTTMTAPTPTTTPDRYQHVLRLVDELSPAERLQLIAYIVKMVQPFVVEPMEDDEDDEELIADAMKVLENTPDDAWIPLDEFEAELDRAEAAGELPR